VRRRAAPRDLGSLVNLVLGIATVLVFGIVLGWLVTRVVP
jgi:hypothetical protein